MIERAGRGLALAAAILLLGGCLDDGRPLEDYLDEIGVENEEREPDAPPTTCTVGGGVAITARFVNGHSRSVNVFWVDDKCVEKPYGRLEAGESRDQGTYAGQPWRFRDGRTGGVLFDWLGAPLDTVANSVVDVVIP